MKHSCAVFIPRFSFLKDDGFLAELEARLLFFTASVVLLACASFALGGTCAAWQWYVPLVLASVWFRGTPHCLSRCKGLHRGSALAFLAVIASMWLYAPLWLDSYANCDTPAYHLPMVRLLTFGWNPFSDPEAHGICAKLGLDWWGMRPYHVAYCSKPAAIFSAVAYSFVRDPYALTYPLPLLLIAAVFATALRVFRKTSIAVPLLMMILLWRYLPRTLFVDCSLMLASAGLLLTMYADFRDNAFSPIPLLGYGFWMLNLKLPGVMAAGVFFIVYGLAKMWRNRDRKTFVRLLLLAVVLSFTSLLASFNPYGTSFRDKGHPLYPFKTVDAERFPVHNMTMDFEWYNDDAAQMGRIGTLVHSYISPRLACAYYNWKLGRTDFAPHKLVWDYRWHDDPDVAIAPTTASERALVVFALLLMLLIPGLRLLGAALLALVVFFPYAQIGFLRYQPWVMSSFCLGCTTLGLCVFRKGRQLRKMALVTFCLMAAWCVVRELNSNLSALGSAVTEVQTMPSQIFSCYVQPKPLLPQSFRDAVAEFLDRKKTHSSNLILRNRQMRIEDLHEVVCIGDEDTEGMVETCLGYFRAKPASEEPKSPKWRRLLHRVGNVRLLVVNYAQRAKRMVGLDA